MRCPHCQSESVVKNGTRRLQDNRIVQYYRCRGCTHNFNDRTRVVSCCVEKNEVV